MTHRKSKVPAGWEIARPVLKDPSFVIPFVGVRPIGVAFNPVTGNMIVSNCHSSDIKVYSPQGELQRILAAGGKEKGDVSYPWYVCTNAEGHIWIADHSNRRVQCLQEDGQFLLSIRMAGQPLGIAVLSNGDIAVSDDLDYVHIYSSDGAHKLAFGGHGTTPGKFWRPGAIAATPNGELAITDHYNHRVQFWTNQGKLMYSVVGMLYPDGIALAKDGSILVSEAYTNHCISAWSQRGEKMYSFGSFGPDPGQFRSPRGIAVLDDGRIAVVDDGNSRVQIF